MTDKLTPERRSQNMRQIRSRGMKPELQVRSIVHRMGFRYRLHARELPGKPDLVFRPRKKAIFVHGCFWHGHADPDCADSRMPKSNQHYWHPKLRRNKERDAANAETLEKSGWKVCVVWECELRDPGAVARRLELFLK